MSEPENVDPDATPEATAASRREAYTPSANVRVLRDGARTLYLVGTAHVSQASVDEVREVIEELQPDTVCVELCQARYDALTDEDRWKNLDIFKVIRDGKFLFLLANLAIGAWQRRIGQELGVTPGAELLAAAEKAHDIGATVRLIDRDIHITLRRTWGNLRFRDKITLMLAIGNSLFAKDDLDGESIEALKEHAHLEDMLEEFSKAFPAVKGPLIDERDQYMASHLQDAPGEVIVAVVGAAHGPGIERAFAAPIDRTPLDRTPPPGRTGTILKWAIPFAILLGFYLGITGENPRSVEEMLFAWVLPNSIAAGVLTLAAGGKLASVLAAVVGSPLTSLNPLLNTGLVVGLVDAWARKPTVDDAARINQDVQSWKGFYRNRFTRVLLVATFAMIGSALGAWVGLAWVFGLVAG
ncbi:MAG: TraB/GumN family protein [Deltaproteobacteria bacterium]|nr:MAG: TraB/GumN family protein [Deltaproteobacteria bacterium]